MYAYNVFRSTGPDGLSCAVPEERSVPSFVTSPLWQFEGRVEAAKAPHGFDGRAAMAGVRFNGCYLFASFESTSSNEYTFDERCHGMPGADEARHA